MFIERAISMVQFNSSLVGSCYSCARFVGPMKLQLTKLSKCFNISDIDEVINDAHYYDNSLTPKKHHHHDHHIDNDTPLSSIACKSTLPTTEAKSGAAPSSSSSSSTITIAETEKESSKKEDGTKSKDECDIVFCGDFCMTSVNGMTHSLLCCSNHLHNYNHLLHPTTSSGTHSNTSAIPSSSSSSSSTMLLSMLMVRTEQQSKALNELLNHVNVKRNSEIMLAIQLLTNFVASCLRTYATSMNESSLPSTSSSANYSSPTNIDIDNDDHDNGSVTITAASSSTTTPSSVSLSSKRKKKKRTAAKKKEETLITSSSGSAMLTPHTSTSSSTASEGRERVVVTVDDWIANEWFPYSLYYSVPWSSLISIANNNDLKLLCQTSISSATSTSSTKSVPNGVISFLPPLIAVTSISQCADISNWYTMFDYSSMISLSSLTSSSASSSSSPSTASAAAGSTSNQTSKKKTQGRGSDKKIDSGNNNIGGDNGSGNTRSLTLVWQSLNNDALRYRSVLAPLALLLQEALPQGPWSSLINVNTLDYLTG
jgi:hypothetical protein